MSLGLKSLIRKADLFGRPLTFENDNSRNFNTLFGMFLSIAIVVVCIVIGFLYGNDIYKRKNAILTTYQEQVQTSRISLKDFPILLYFSDTYGNDYTNIENVLDFQISQFDFSETGAIADVRIKSNGFSLCNLEYYNDLHRERLERQLEEFKNRNQTAYCIMLDIPTFQNAYTAPNSTFINMALSKCDKTTNENCSKTVENEVGGVYVSVMWFEALLSPDRYNDPISYYSKVHTKQLSNGFLKRSFLSFAVNELETDEGWLLESMSSMEYVLENRNTNDINVLYDDPSLNKHIYWITLDSPNIRMKNFRKYMKVQDLLASIGGFFKGITLICYVITYPYVDFEFHMDILKGILHRHDTVTKNLSYLKSTKNISNNAPSQVLEEKRQTPEILKKETHNQPTRKLINTDNATENNNLTNSSKHPMNNFMKSNLKSNNLQLLPLKNIKPNASSIDLQFLQKEKITDSLSSLTNISKDNFFHYIFVDIFCCKNKFQNAFSTVRKLINFKAYYLEQIDKEIS